jgi:hypothetical protein
MNTETPYDRTNIGWLVPVKPVLLVQPEFLIVAYRSISIEEACGQKQREEH